MSDDKEVKMTPKELRTLMRETVLETLTTLGVDVHDPIEMQKDFQHVRDWRESMAAVRSRSLTIAVGTVVAGILAALWIGLKDIITQ